MKLSDNVKTAIVVLIVIAVVAIAYITLPKTTGTFDKGAEINSETFVELFGDANKIYIVMDLRDASGAVVRTNIMQCGVDFAGSYGLVDKDVTYMSLEGNDCVIGNTEGTGTYALGECLDMLNDGVSLYVIEGDETKYYAKAAMVGVNEEYVMGTCSVGSVPVN